MTRGCEPCGNCIVSTFLCPDYVICRPVYKSDPLYGLDPSLLLKGLTLQRYPVPRVHPSSPIAGLCPGTDSDNNVTEPKALTVQSSPHRGRKSDPTWLACQSCWHCGKLGHLCQRCTASQAKRDAYRGQKNAEGTGGDANAVEPEVYLNAMMAEETDGHAALHAEGNPAGPRHWLVDSGCSNHFSPN